VIDKRVEMAKLTLDTVTSLMDFLEDNKGNKIWWAHCFGGMLEYIADRTFSIDYDVDIGVLYGHCEPQKIINAFEGYGYKTKIMIVNDINKKPLNIHFEPKEERFLGTPTIDVFFWVPIGDKYYHTYDTMKEGKKVPSRYVFKGVKKWWFTPSKSIIYNEKKIGKPGREQFLTDQGTWKFPVFGSDNGLTMRVPYAIGHLLDEWYGKTWIFREYYRGQSMSRWIKKVKSCAELVE